MTMFHTRGWGEEDNRLVSRVDFKHTQLLARRRPGQGLPPGSGDAPGSAGLSLGCHRAVTGPAATGG